MNNDEKLIELRRAVRLMLLFLSRDEPEVKELFTDEELVTLEIDLSERYNKDTGTLEDYLKMILGL